MPSKLTGLTELTDVATTDLLYIVDDPGGSPLSKKATVANVAAAGQQAHIIDADGSLADITTKFNTLLAALEARGILAGSQGAIWQSRNTPEALSVVCQPMSGRRSRMAGF